MLFNCLKQSRKRSSISQHKSITTLRNSRPLIYRSLYNKQHQSENKVVSMLLLNRFNKSQSHPRYSIRKTLGKEILITHLHRSDSLTPELNIYEQGFHKPFKTFCCRMTLRRALQFRLIIKTLTNSQFLQKECMLRAR